MITKENYKIRKIKPDDFLDLHQIYFLAWLNTYPNEEFNITAEDIVYKYEQRLMPEKIEESKKKIAQTKENELKLLLEYNKKVVALCNVVKNKGYNQLQSIYVLPEYQGLGIGGCIWLEAEKFLDPYKKTIVRVTSYNNKAINFYEKLGFKSTGKIFKEDKFKMRNGAVFPELEMVRPPLK
jgi:ribosomal protein S18 acetylase RimI-like enzyme